MVTDRLMENSWKRHQVHVCTANFIDLGKQQVIRKGFKTEFWSDKKALTVLTLLSSNVSVRTISSFHYFCLTFLISDNYNCSPWGNPHIKFIFDFKMLG